MGLFDMFNGTPPELSPKLSLAVGLQHMVNADGQVEAEEIGNVLQGLFRRFLSAYGVSEQTIEPYTLGIALKNKREILE